MSYNIRTMEEKEIKCVEKTCEQMFIITVGEQEFYTDKGMYLPKRCPDCRAKRKAEKEKRAEREN